MLAWQEHETWCHHPVIHQQCYTDYQTNSTVQHWVFSPLTHQHLIRSFPNLQKLLTKTLRHLKLWFNYCRANVQCDQLITCWAKSNRSWCISSLCRCTSKCSNTKVSFPIPIPELCVLAKTNRPILYQCLRNIYIKFKYSSSFNNRTINPVWMWFDSYNRYMAWLRLNTLYAFVPLLQRINGTWLCHSGEKGIWVTGGK